MPYVIDFSRDSHAALSGLPAPAAEDLGSALGEASLDPYRLPTVAPALPSSRVLPFADGHGYCLLEIVEEKKRVLVSSVTWLG